MGLRELVLVAMVAVALYGRSGVVKSRQVQTILPWLSPRRRTGGPSERARSTPAGATQKSAQGQAFLAAGKPLVLVLDDPGRDRRGRLDHLSRDDSQRREQRAHSLSWASRRCVQPSRVRRSRASSDITLI